MPVHQTVTSRKRKKIKRKGGVRGSTKGQPEERKMERSPKEKEKKHFQYRENM